MNHQRSSTKVSSRTSLGPAMKASTKAACLSAFLFPGCGHVFLKCYVRAGVFIVIAAVGLYMMMAEAFTIAQTIAEDILLGRISHDIQGIRAVVQQAMAVYTEPSLVAAKGAILVSWVISTVDAYRLGRQVDRQQVDKRQVDGRQADK